MENKNIPVYLDDFKNYLIAIRNLSELYVKKSMITIMQFLDFANIHIFHNKYSSAEEVTLNDLRTLQTSDIYSFMFFLAENNYKTNSRITKTEHIRCFFDFLSRIKKTLFKEPIKPIKREKKSNQKLPNYLSLEESKKLISVYLNSENEAGIRNNAILNILLNCGLRVSEVSNLNISDFKLDENKFVIYGKGDKERTGYLNTAAKKALEKYLEVREKIIPKSKKDKDALFINQRGERIKSRGIELMVKKSYDKAGLNSKKYGVHTLRHTCATILYRIGVDIKIIQEILGHVQVDTTEIYTHLFDKDVMAEMLKHPLSKFMMSDAMSFALEH